MKNVKTKLGASAKCAVCNRDIIMGTKTWEHVGSNPRHRGVPLTLPLRDFVRLPNGRLGLIVANDSCGGVFRGHYAIWFGEIRDGKPVVEQICGAPDWSPLTSEEIER